MLPLEKYGVKIHHDDVEAAWDRIVKGNYVHKVAQFFSFGWPVAFWRIDGMVDEDFEWFEAKYPGIVSQAVFLTFGTLVALLVAYRSGLIKATENFKLGVVAATGGIFFVYLISFVLGFFGVNVSLIHGSGTFGILFSLFVVVIAALNLVLDFDFIEEGAERGAPK